jgi:hypothetical protein
MFPDKELIVEADPRTNQVLVRCNSVMKDRIRELMDRIDQPGKEPPRAENEELIRGGLVLLGEEPPGRSLRRGGRLVWQAGPQHLEQDVLIRVDEAQQQIVALTDQIRALRQATEPDEKALAALEQQLTERVKAAFDARQALHRAELEVLRQQLASIEQTIAARDRLKDQLVEQRVQDLISGKVEDKWEVRVYNKKDVLIPVPDGPPGGPIVAPLPPLPAASPAPPTSAAPPEGPNTFRPYDAIVAPGTAAPNYSTAAPAEAASPLPTVIRQHQLRAQQAEIRAQLKGLETEMRNTDPATVQILRAQAHGMHSSIEVLEKEAQVLSLELQAKRRAAELQLRSAELQYQAAEEQMKRTQTLFETGQGTAEMLTQHKLQYEQAKLQVQQAKNLLELFKQIDEGAPR